MDVIDMAKAHLQNVDRKIGELIDQRNAIQSEIEKFVKYIEEGQAEIMKAEAKPEAVPTE